MWCLIILINFVSSGARKTLPPKAFPPIESEREIGDDELEELALNFCSPEVLNGMTDANWKTRLANVQEFSQVCVKYLGRLFNYIGYYYYCCR